MALNERGVAIFLSMPTNVFMGGYIRDLAKNESVKDMICRIRHCFVWAYWLDTGNISTIYLSTCVSLCLPSCLSVYLPVYLSTYLSACYLPLSLSNYQSICLPACLSVYLPVSLSTYLSVCYLSVSMSNHQSVCLPACLSVYLPLTLSIYLLVWKYRLLNVFVKTFFSAVKVINLTFLDLFKV